MKLQNMFARDRLVRRSIWMVFVLWVGVALVATSCAPMTAAARPNNAHPTASVTEIPAPTASPTAAPSTAAMAAPKAYIGLFKDNAVAVFDTGANRVLTTIPVPTGPHGLVVTADGRTVYVSSDGDSKVSVIDTAIDQVKSSIQVGQMPHGLAITPDGRQVLAAVFGASQVAFIDTTTNQVTGQVPVPNPHNIAISPDGHTAYVAAQMPGKFGLTILDVVNKTQVGSIPLDKTPRALNFSPDGKQLYFTLAGADAVQVLDTASNKLVAQIPVGASPHHPLFIPNGQYALVVSQGPGELNIINPATNTVSKTVKVGTLPHWIAIDAKGETAWVTNEGSNDVSVVDIATGRVTATIPVGQAPRKIVVQPQAATTAQNSVKTVIAGFSFAPTITVTAGQMIVWTNTDAVPHSVTSDQGLFDSGDIGPGQSYRMTLDKPGAHTYHCMHHPYMKGTVIVTA